MIAFLILVVVLGSIVEWLSMRKPIDKLEYHCRPIGVCHEPDEFFTVEAVIDNRSKHSFHGLQMAERFPAFLETVGSSLETVPEGDRFMTVKSVISIRGRQRLYRSRRAKIRHRGRYIFSGAVFTIGDFLGIQTKQEERAQWEEVVIYPKALVLDTLQTVLDGFYGDVSVRRRLIEDPVLISGFREYTGVEPLRAVSWTQSARRGQMMVKEFDYTQDRTATVILNVQDRDFAQTNLRSLEVCYALVRTVSEFLEEHAVQYRFFHNSVCAGAEETKWQFTNLGSHLEGVLEALGRAAYFSSENMAALIERVMNTGEERQAYYLITPAVTEELQSVKERLETDGALVCVLAANEYEAEEGEAV